MAAVHSYTQMPNKETPRQGKKKMAVELPPSFHVAISYFMLSRDCYENIWDHSQKSSSVMLDVCQGIHLKLKLLTSKEEKQTGGAGE